MPNFRAVLRFMAVLVLLMALTIFCVTNRESLVNLAYLGYPGIFIACVLSNSSVFLPAPSSAIVFTFASIYPPFLVAVLGAAGAAVGELGGYLAGYFGRGAISRKAPENSGTGPNKYIRQYGQFAVFLFAFLPLPLFDLVGVTAGASKMRLWRFIGYCLAGKLVKMFIYAYAGAGLMPVIAPWIRQIMG